MNKKETFGLVVDFSDSSLKYTLKYFIMWVFMPLLILYSRLFNRRIVLKEVS